MRENLRLGVELSEKRIVNKLLIATVLISSVLSLITRAQSPPPTVPSLSTSPTATPTGAETKVDPEKDRVIRSVLAKTREVEMAQERILQGLTGMKQLMPRIPEKYWVEYREKISANELRDRLVRVYDKHFTPEELKAILEFYDSAAGKKLSAAMMPILRESMEIAQDVSKRAGEEVAKDLRTEQLLQQPRAAGSVPMPPLPPSNPLPSIPPVPTPPPGSPTSPTPP
jgi:hypothetical protein